MTAPPMPPAKANTGQQTMASMLYERMRADIIRGKFKPGFKLKVSEISAMYGVGTIPVREALSRLATSGFVESRDQRGFAVREVSASELLDITRVRLMVESAALREAIEQGDFEWEARVIGASHALSRFSAYSDPARRVVDPKWEAAHDELHRQLLSGCSSPWLLKFADELRDQATRYRHISAGANVTPSRDVVKEHDSIVEATVARKADLAVALLCEHISTSTSIAVSEFPGKEGTMSSKLLANFPRPSKASTRSGAPPKAVV